VLAVVDVTVGVEELAYGAENSIFKLAVENHPRVQQQVRLSVNFAILE